MSSIIVKGLRMPENCIACPMQFGGWCYAAPPEIDERVAPTVDEAVEKGKPEWCPLVDLGKHGRLIDADKLMDDIKKNSASYFADDFAREWVDVQPTVIEAEGTDEGSN